MASSFFQSILKPELIRMHLAATDKDAAIREMLDILEHAKLLQDRAEAERIVFEREHCMSTGMEFGVAIPHGKTPTVDRLIAALALKPEGLDFDSVDKQPARVFIITLSPVNQTGPHLRFMAEVSKILRSPKIRAALMSAKTPDEVIRLLTAEGR